MASKRVGKIYKILINDDFYIGSTWDFDKRLGTHKSYSKTSDIKLYKAIRANNNKFEMTLLYKYECYTDEELKIEERKCYYKLKPSLNMYRPYRTEEEKIEYTKQYNIKNREKITEMRKQNYIKNRETILERKKQYRIENKYICGCGSSVINQNVAIKRHEQTKKHKNYLFEM